MVKQTRLRRLDKEAKRKGWKGAFKCKKCGVIFIIPPEHPKPTYCDQCDFKEKRRKTKI